MKHIIEFNLPEEREELKMTMQAGAFHSALWEMANQLRSWCKHSDETSVEFEILRDKFYEILKDNEVEL